LTGGVAGSVAGSDAASGGQQPACDRDGDGYRSRSCGGDDCDDGDATVHPGAWDTNTEPGPWITEFAFGEIPDDSRGRTSLAVDSDGVAHVAEGRNGLRYANNESGSWLSESVDEASTGVPSLALGPNGTVLIAYTASNQIRLATRYESEWVVTPITVIEPPPVFLEGACSLVVDRQGHLHLLYATPGEVCYASRSGGIWYDQACFAADETIAPKIALDSRAAPHWIFGTSDALVYATSCESGYCASEVSPGQVMDADLTIDAADTVHLAYGFLRLDAPLVYGVLQTDRTWLEETIAPSSSWTVDLATSPPGSPWPLHLAHLDEVGVLIGHRETNTWVSERLAPHGYGVSLALEGPNVAHFAHTDFMFDVNTYVSYHTNRSIAPDGIDQNCDGVDGVDRDGDGHASTRTGGGDCDDHDPSVHAPASGGTVGSDCEGGDG
jgi:hypothetical protein